MIKLESISRTNLEKHRLSHQGRDNQYNLFYLYELIFRDSMDFNSFIQFAKSIESLMNKVHREYDKEVPVRPSMNLNSEKVKLNIHDGYIYGVDLKLLDKIDENLNEYSQKSLELNYVQEFLELRKLSKFNFLKHKIFSAEVVKDIEIEYLIGAAPHPDCVDYHDCDFLKSATFPVMGWNKQSSRFGKFIGSHTRFYDWDNIKFISTLPDFYLDIVNLNESSEKLVITEGCMDAISICDKLNWNRYVCGLSSGYLTFIQLIQLVAFIGQYGIKEVDLAQDSDNVGIVNSYLISMYLKELCPNIKVNIVHLLNGCKDFDEATRDLTTLDYEVLDPIKFRDKYFANACNEMATPGQYEDYVDTRKMFTKTII